MKKIFLVLAVLFCVLLANCYATTKVSVVTETWPPYIIEENNQPSGFDYEVMAAVFKKLGIELDFKFLPWKRCIKMIKEKKADAILDASKNDDRLTYMFFPEEQISESGTTLFYLKSQNFDYQDLNDLKGKTVGVTPGYSYNDAFDKATFFKKEAVKSNESNFKKLLKGRIDFFLVNRNVGLFVAKNMGILDQINYSQKRISGGANFLAFSQKPGNDQLAKNFSQALKEFKKTVEYKNILAKYGQ